jgi:hypothetical protein
MVSCKNFPPFIITPVHLMALTVSSPLLKGGGKERDVWSVDRQRSLSMEPLAREEGVEWKFS